MAEEAFALSPISARASLPSEGDYAAIREAFMETARGRWFLSEYAKRNRNADTSMVLDAVARIEATLAAQKQAPAIVGLAESLGVIRSAIREAKVAAAEAMPRADTDGILVAARNGARIIREIAWTLRECGADTRICDLLDAQVKAIDAGQQQTTDLDSRSAVLATFDTLVHQIEQLASGNTARPPTNTPASPSTTVASDAAPETMAEKHRASITPLFRTAPDVTADLSIDTPPAVDEPQSSLTVEAAIEAPPVASQAAEMLAAIASNVAANDMTAASAESATSALDAETAEDQAVLDIIALEMAAPDPGDAENMAAGHFAAGGNAQGIAATESGIPDVAVLTTADAAAPIESAPIAPALNELAQAMQSAPALLPTPTLRIEAHQSPPAERRSLEPPARELPSLGAALIANGVISNPAAPASDPLAPFCRMSQAEKIAFFS